jgi:hypothetical protein
MINEAIKYASAILCKTPRNLNEDQSQSCLINGNAFIISPIEKIDIVLKIILLKSGPVLHKSYLSKEKLIDIPTINRKNGKTKSVNVHPCHCACLKGP